MCLLSPDRITALSTGVLTLATILYAIFTYQLWRETKKAGEAAAKSADAAAMLAQSAKDSADAAIELNRPFLGVAEIQLPQLPGIAENVKAVVPGARRILITLKNDGSVSGRVMVDWKCYMQTESETRSDGHQGPIDIGPGSSCSITLSVRIDPNDAGRIRDGREYYKVKLQAEYSAPFGKRSWRCTAVRVLGKDSTFSMDEQMPDRTEQIS